MLPTVLFDQIFWRWNEIELTVDSVFLKCANDTVFTWTANLLQLNIFPEGDSTLINSGEAGKHEQ